MSVRSASFAVQILGVIILGFAFVVHGFLFPYIISVFLHCAAAVYDFLDWSLLSILILGAWGIFLVTCTEDLLLLSQIAMCSMVTIGIGWGSES